MGVPKPYCPVPVKPAPTPATETPKEMLLVDADRVIELERELAECQRERDDYEQQVRSLKSPECWIENGRLKADLFAKTQRCKRLEKSLADCVKVIEAYYKHIDLEVHVGALEVSVAKELLDRNKEPQ